MTTRFLLLGHHPPGTLPGPAVQPLHAHHALLRNTAVGSLPGSCAGSCCLVATADHNKYLDSARCAMAG